jgi:hypothetical protein
LVVSLWSSFLLLLYFVSWSLFVLFRSICNSWLSYSSTIICLIINFLCWLFNSFYLCRYRSLLNSRYTHNWLFQLLSGYLLSLNSLFFRFVLFFWSVLMSINFSLNLIWWVWS